MRILAFNYEYPPLGGGGGVVFRQIAETLCKRHRMTVVTTHFGDLKRSEHRGGLEIIRVPVWGRKELSTAGFLSLLSYFPSSWRCGRKLLRAERFDIINSHFAVPSAPSAHLLARRFGLPHVLSVHGGDLYDPSKRFSPHRVPGVRRIVRHLLLGADRVVAQSNNTALNARQLYGVQRPIDIIPLGIDPPAFENGMRGTWDIEPDRFVMVTVGRLIARKALDDLLHVVAALDDPRDYLIVIGDGPKQAELEEMARRLGIATRVRFFGRVGEIDKWKLLSLANLYVSTSLHEGFGLVFLEAMHCSLPVACYDHGGQSDFLEDGTTGALIPLGRRDDFVAAVRRLKESPSTALRCGRDNRERVRAFYIDTCAARYEDLFETLISRGQHPKPPRAGSDRDLGCEP